MKKCLLLCLLVIAVGSCDWSKSKDNVDHNGVDVVEGPQMPLNIDEQGSYTSLDAVRAEFKAVVESRKLSDPYAFTILTDSYWTWEGFFDGKNFLDIPKEQWIKFEENFTYTYGFGADVNGSGIFHFRMRDQNLMMLDNNPKLQPKQFTFSDGGMSIVLEGKPGFQMNNGMQMKLNPHPTRPTK